MTITIQLLISILLSYVLSIGMLHITNYKILELILEREYSLSNDDRTILWEEIDIPKNKTLFILHQIPYLNIIATMIDSYYNIINIDTLITELETKNIIKPMKRGPGTYYAEHKKYEEIKIATQELIAQNPKDYSETLSLIDSSNNLSYQYKVTLLKILKFSITNRIENLDIKKLLESIKNKDKLFYPNYFKLFHLIEYFNKETKISILYELNKIINTDTIDIKAKEKVMNEISLAIFEKVENTKPEEIQYLKINIQISEEDINSYTLEITKNKKQRRKLKEHRN